MAFDVDKMVAFDLETHLIEPGILAPKIVCGSWAMSPTFQPSHGLLDRDGAINYAVNVLRSEDLVLVGANISYDLGCLVADPWSPPDLLPLIFEAYEQGRVYDVQIAQALHHIAEGNLYIDLATGQPMRGRYSLDRCVQYVLGRSNAKANDYWRLRYALLESTPIDEWPPEAKQYPIDDACNTLEVAIAQVKGGGAGMTPGPHRNLGDLPNQAETAFAMHLGAMWGLRTDSERVDALHRRTEEAHESFVKKFSALGFFKDDGKKNQIAIKRAVVRAYGGELDCLVCGGSQKVLSEKTKNPINCTACSGTGMDISNAPKTATGGVSADRDTLAESSDTDLAELGDNEAEKLRETYLPWIKEGTARPITLRPNVLVASGRTSYDGLIQLLPRASGVRDLFRARPGYVYCSVDYAALELCTLAQVCYWILGHSHMMETINANGDPGSLHTAFAARLAGLTTEEMTALIKAKDENAKRLRQAAKPGNFGFPGGMGAAKFVLAQRKKNAGETVTVDGTKYPGVRFCVLLRGAERCGEVKVTEWRGRPTPPLCRECVEVVDNQLRPAWFAQWPEMKEYFGWVSRRVENGGELPCFATERVRGGLDFTNGCNNGFQALAADGAKYALRKVVREAYLDESSPLYGTRPIMFIHDEIFSEMPEATAHLAGPRKAEIMISAMREYVKDVTIKAEPSLMRFWSKEAADSTYDKAGKLIPWEESEAA